MFSSLIPSRGVLPVMTYTGRLHRKGVPFLGFRYERVGTVISLCRGDQKGSQQEKNTTEEVEKTLSFCDLFVSAFAADFTYMKGSGNLSFHRTRQKKSRRRSRFVIYSSVHFQQLKAVQSAILGMLKGYHFVNRRYTKEVPFPSKG